MSYEKHIWRTGETVTAENLNHIEDALADKYLNYDFVLSAFGSEGLRIVKGTFADIYAKITHGENVIGLYEDNTGIDIHGSVTSISVPLTRTFYYSSSGKLHISGVYSDGSPLAVNFAWGADDNPDYD